MTLCIATKGKVSLHGMAFWMEGQGLVARKLTFDGSLVFVCGKCGNMLNGNVFLTAKTTTYQHGFNYYTIRRLIPSKHVRDFFARIVSTLIGGEDFDTVLIRECNRTFRLKECMLGKRCREVLRYGKGRVFQRFFCVAACDMTALAKIALCFFMYQWCSLSTCLIDITYHRKLFILNFYKLLCGFQGLLVFRHNHAERIAHIARNGTFGDKDIPVLLNMPNLVYRHIFGFKNTNHTRQSFCLRDVNL